MKKNDLARREQTANALLAAAEKWPSDFLSRKDLVIFAGNSISLGYLQNLDSRGQGPDDSFYLGRRIVYPKRSAVEWLIKRISHEGIAPARQEV